jgi:hypothetical protein
MGTTGDSSSGVGGVGGAQSSDASTTGDSCEAVQCLRPYECALSCDSPTLYTGCCPCQAGQIDKFLECDNFDQVRVIRGDPATAEWWDLTIRGEQFGEFEGKTVTVRVGSLDWPPERLGSAKALITRGAFELRFPQVWEANLYKLKAAFIDSDDDGLCDPASGDLVFQDARATPHFVLSLQNGPDQLQLDMPESYDPDKTCSYLNAAWPTE